MTSSLAPASAPHQPLDPRLRPILVVEDSDEDYEILSRSVRQIGITPQLIRCETGRQALDYLAWCLEPDERGWGRELPCLILLDLNLPGIDGRGVLRAIEQNPLLKGIPSVVLTTSNNPRDVADCYQLGINSYLIKAMEYSKFKETIHRLFTYWLDTVILP